MKTNGWSWLWFFSLLTTNILAIDRLDTALLALVKHKIMNPAQITNFGLQFYSTLESKTVTFSLVPIFVFFGVALGSACRNYIYLKRKMPYTVLFKLVLLLFILSSAGIVLNLWFSWVNPTNVSDSELALSYVSYLTVKADFVRGPEVTYSLMKTVIWLSISILFVSAPSFKKEPAKTRFST